MRGYRFRLEPVLRVRQLQEERARASLAMARRAEAEAREQTTRRRGLLAAARAAGLPDGSRHAWSQERDRQDRLAGALLASQVAEAHAADLATRELGRWEEAVVALRTLERLDERKREEHRIEQGQAEQKVLDELVNARTATARRGERASRTDESGRAAT